MLPTYNVVVWHIIKLVNYISQKWCQVECMYALKTVSQGNSEVSTAPLKIFNPPSHFSSLGIWCPALLCVLGLLLWCVCLGVCVGWVVRYFLSRLSSSFLCWCAMNNPSRDAEKGKATTTTQQKGKATQHNSPETVIFQRKIGCLWWDLTHDHQLCTRVWEVHKHGIWDNKKCPVYWGVLIRGVQLHVTTALQLAVQFVTHVMTHW